jgi:DNA-binding response OmpR family regulator
MAGSPIHILLVEDDAPLRTVLAEILREDGYAVQEAADGRAALELLRVEPDAVVLDLQLARRDGLGFIRALRDHPGGERVPLLVVSGAAPAPELAARLCADAVVPKPFDLDELLGAVYRLSHTPA